MLFFMFILFFVPNAVPKLNYFSIRNSKSGYRVDSRFKCVATTQLFEAQKTCALRLTIFSLSCYNI